jgi:WD40 repeat protein
MSMDGRIVVTVSIQKWDRTYEVFDTVTGRSWASSEGQFRKLELSPDGSSFLAIGGDSQLGRWRINQGTAHADLPLVEREKEIDFGVCHRLVFSPNGHIAVHARSNAEWTEEYPEISLGALDARELGQLKEWTYRPGRPENPRPDVKLGAGLARRILFGPTAAVGPDNRTVAIGSRNSPRLRFFDIITGEEKNLHAGHVVPVSTLRATASGRTIVSVGTDRLGRTWDINSIRNPAPLAGCRSRAVGREFTALGEITGDDLPAPVPLRVPPRIKVVYDRDRNRMQGRLDDTELVVWEDSVPGLADIDVSERPGVLPEVWDRDGVLVAVQGGSAVTVRDPTTGEELMVFRVTNARPTSVELVPDAELLAVGYDNGEILLWDLRPADMHRRAPTSAEFERLWADFAGTPRDALRARMILLAYPDAAIAMLRSRVRGLSEPTGADVSVWLTQLYHPRHSVREAATRALANHFEACEKAVRETLATTNSPEVEHRLKLVLEMTRPLDGPAEVVRLTRAVSLLERIGTKEARELIFRVARGSGMSAARATDALVRIRDRATAGKPLPMNEPQATRYGHLIFN